MDVSAGGAAASIGGAFVLAPESSAEPGPALSVLVSVSPASSDGVTFPGAPESPGLNGSGEAPAHPVARASTTAAG